MDGSNDEIEKKKICRILTLYPQLHPFANRWWAEIVKLKYFVKRGWSKEVSDQKHSTS